MEHIKTVVFSPKPKEEIIDLKKINEYLKIRKAAKYLGVSEATMRNWERSNKIKSYRNPLSNYRLYDKKDLESILSSIRSSIT